MAGREVTRATLQRQLVTNALTKPANVLVPAAMVVAGLLVGTLWLVAAALVVYGALSAITFFDADEAERVGKEVYGRGRGPEPRRLDPGNLAEPIGQQLRAALTEESRIKQAIADADLPFTEVGAEVDGLVDAMESIAGRAQRIYSYLVTQDPPRVYRRLEELRAAGAEDDPQRRELVRALKAQIDAQNKLTTQLERFYSQMEHVTASLGAVHAQVVTMSVAGEAEAQDELVGQVRGLREEVDVLAAGMSEAYAQSDAPAGTGSLPPSSAA